MDDGRGPPCLVFIDEGPTYLDIDSWAVTLDSYPGKIVIQPYPGTSQKRINDAKSALIRANRRFEILNRLK